MRRLCRKGLVTEDDCIMVSTHARPEGRLRPWAKPLPRMGGPEQPAGPGQEGGRETTANEYDRAGGQTPVREGGSAVQPATEGEAEEWMRPTAASESERAQQNPALGYAEGAEPEAGERRFRKELRHPQRVTCCED